MDNLEMENQFAEDNHIASIRWPTIGIALSIIE